MNPNPSAVEPPTLALIAPPQPPVPQPPRSSFSCDRHPAEHFSGFCPSCLCERLAGLDQSSSLRKSAAAGTLSSTATAALKAIFRPSSSSAAAAAPPAGGGAAFGGGGGGSKRNSTSSKPSSSFFAELRRTKSFSASKGEGFSGVFEPQRKSCDVRVRNTLWSLFTQDDERKGSRMETRASAAAAAGNADVDIANTLLPSSTSVRGPVLEEDGDDIETENQDQDRDEIEGDDEIRIFEEAGPNIAVNNDDDDGGEIVEEIVEADGDSCRVVKGEEEEDLKPMKEHIDLDSQMKKPAGRDLKEIAGSFWSAASVFSKKLQKWRRKQKLKKRGDGSASASLPAAEKPLGGRQYRETQSEVADYCFGRRSCDTDPRFSLDAGRMSLDAGRISFDDPRYSFDEPPRVSWDGYLIGRTLPPRLPPMVSVVEDAPPVPVPVPDPAPVPVRAVSSRTDNQIAVEAPAMDLGCINEDETIPGGSAQTREYYSDPSSRRRKSLDRSSSIRKTAAAVVAEIEELKSVSNAKVSPATVDYFSGSKVLGAADRELVDSNSSLRGDDCSESFELPGFRDTASVASVSVASVFGNGDQKAAAAKKSRRWKVWNIWGLIYRRSGGKDEDDDRFSRLNGVERSFSESWHDFRSQGSGDVKGPAFNRGVFRSNSSVSSRNLYNLGGGGGGSARKSGVEANGHASKKKKDEFVLERNRSARYSPGHLDSGLLRFYLTPLRGSRRSGSGKNRLSTSHSIARSVLRLY